VADQAYLSRAAGGIQQASANLAAALKAQGVAASDEDLPTGARAPFREAVKAVEYAINRMIKVAEIVGAARAEELKRASKNA
jgi:hypothetical protein